MIPETKACPKCGWVYPANYANAECRFCGTPFTQGVCSKCGEWATWKDGSTLCDTCKNKKRKNQPRLAKRVKIRRNARAAVSLDFWLARCRKVPFRALSEQEWLDACKHFGCCAICGKEEISARGFFVPFKLGGRYVRWNVIPLCEKCAVAHAKQLNPFSRLNYFINSAANPEALTRILDYLTPILTEEVSNEHKKGSF